MNDDTFKQWFVGYVDGEGCFEFRFCPEKHQVYTGICITARWDDLPMLQYVHSNLGIGTVYHKSDGTNRSGYNRQSFYQWAARSCKDMYSTIIPIIDRYPLRSKKQYEYALWKDVVTFFYNNNGSKYYLDDSKCEYLLSMANKIRAIKEGCVL